MARQTPSISRRKFINSATVLGLATGVSSVLPRSGSGKPQQMPLSDGRVGESSTFDLAVDELGLQIGSRGTVATAINGSVPGPLLRFREGQDAVIRVKNHLSRTTSIHWHGLIVPFDMDGVPGVSYPGIEPGDTFEYKFPVRQSGTYWYHSHSGFQEQTGMYGPLIIDPAGPEKHEVDREHIIVLGDWTYDDPHAVLRNLQKRAGYYNYNRRTLATLLRDAGRDGFGKAVRERLMWNRMRMDATDIADVTGATYTYLINGKAPTDNWTGLFKPGERVRLRFINAGAGTIFDVRIPGLPMTVVQSDGQDVQPVTVDEFRIAIAETYDVIVNPPDDKPYTIFAEAMDRSGFAAGTLATATGMLGEIPKRREPPSRSMADMGMDHGAMVDPSATTGAEGMNGMEGMDHGAMVDPSATTGVEGMNGMEGMDHGGPPMPAHAEMDRGASGLAPLGSIPLAAAHTGSTHGPGNAAVPTHTMSRLHEPGIGLGRDNRRVLTYADLRSDGLPFDTRPPEREISLHLTGNMEKYMWSFDGLEYSRSPKPIQIKLGERVRMTLVNDTMMEHPIHLHGMWMVLENGTGEELPRKHTINVKPAERLSVIITPDTPGPWAMHCHILYHMDMGMFRVVEVVEAIQ